MGRSRKEREGIKLWPKAKIERRKKLMSNQGNTGISMRGEDT